MLSYVVHAAEVLEKNKFQKTEQGDQQESKKKDKNESDDEKMGNHHHGTDDDVDDLPPHSDPQWIQTIVTPLPPQGEEGEDERCPPPAPIAISGGVDGRATAKGLLSARL